MFITRVIYSSHSVDRTFMTCVVCSSLAIIHIFIDRLLTHGKPHIYELTPIRCTNLLLNGQNERQYKHLWRHQNIADRLDKVTKTVNSITPFLISFTVVPFVVCSFLFKHKIIYLIKPFNRSSDENANIFVSDYSSKETEGHHRCLAVACWTTDHYHPCSNLGAGTSEGCFIFDVASLPLEVARPI